MARPSAGNQAPIVTGELINAGLMLMLVGMGTVFAFLTILVMAMTLMSNLVARLQPVSVPPLPGENPAEIAAVAAAVEHHRRSIRS